MGIMHFSDYKQSVILAYQRLRNEEGGLSSNLKRPTPAKLKKECLLVFEDRYSKEDNDTLRSFFGSKNDPNEYIQAIKKFDTDKFRPLNIFLRNNKRNTDDRNIELLAWLINFKPRPYIFGKSTVEDINTNQESEATDKTEEGKQHGNEETNQMPRGDKTEEESPNNQNTDQSEEFGTSTIGKGWFTSKKNIISIVIFTLATSGIYWVNGTYDISNKAYICDRGTGKKYHLNSTCPLLKNCKNEFVQTTIVDAEKNGKTLCGFEHR